MYVVTPDRTELIAQDASNTVAFSSRILFPKGIHAEDLMNLSPDHPFARTLLDVYRLSEAYGRKIWLDAGAELARRIVS